MQRTASGFLYILLVLTANATAQDNPSKTSFEQREFAEAYDKVGSHNPAWDHDARLLLQHSAFAMSSARLEPRDDEYAAEVLAARLTKIGCDDPCVYACALRSQLTFGLKLDPVMQSNLSDQVESCDYSPFVKLGMYKRLMGAALKSKRSASRDAKIEKWCSAFCGQLAPALAEKDCPPAAVMDLCKDITSYYKEFFNRQKSITEQITAALIKTPQPWLADWYLGKVNWDASFYGPLADEPGDYGQLRMQRHDTAEKHFLAAINKAPHLAQIKADMIGLQVDMGNVDKAHEFFHQAVADDPGCADAYMFEAAALNTGSEEDNQNLVQFGLKCLATKDWDSGVPWELRDCRDKVCMRTVDQFADPSTDQMTQILARMKAYSQTYRKYPELMKGMCELYESYIKLHPDAVDARYEYAEELLSANRVDDAVPVLGWLKKDHDPLMAHRLQSDDLMIWLRVNMTNEALIRLAKKDTKGAMHCLQGSSQLVNSKDFYRWKIAIDIWLAEAMQGKQKQADQELTAFMAAQPVERSSSIMRDTAQYLLGQLDEAKLIEISERAAHDEKDPPHKGAFICGTHYFIGMKYLIQSDYESATEQFQSAVDANADGLAEFDASKAELKWLDAQK